MDRPRVLALNSHQIVHTTFRPVQPRGDRDRLERSEGLHMCLCAPQTPHRLRAASTEIASPQFLTLVCACVWRGKQRPLLAPVAALYVGLRDAGVGVVVSRRVPLFFSSVLPLVSVYPRFH